MRFGVAGVALLLAAACGRVAAADPAPEQQLPSQVEQSAPVALPLPPAAKPPTLRCNDQATQGGAILCRTEPLATVYITDPVLGIADKPIATATADGIALIGLTRNQGEQVKISIKPVLSEIAVRSQAVQVLPRHDTVAKFEMECAKISPQSKADQKKAEVSWVKKDKALREFSPPLAPVSIAKPAEGRYSSPFGATRTYIPKTNKCEGSTSVHNGQDIAIGTGTEVRAPMAGTVILADPDLFYEGGCVFLDLGYGLVSVTMHLSRVDVKAGDKIEQGALLGLSGATGRVTGPHLHWAMKFRNVHSDDRGTDIWLDPVLLMGLKAPPATP